MTLPKKQSKKKTETPNLVTYINLLRNLRTYSDQNLNRPKIRAKNTEPILPTVKE